MKYINLIDQISEHDKVILKNYIELYGAKKHFIGVDEWLQDWSHSNQRLYRLLGNSLTKEFNYVYEKNRDDLYREYNSLFLHDPFYNKITDFLIAFTCADKEMEYEEKRKFRALTAIETFLNGKVKDTIKYKREGANKILQIQAGAKPLKALYRIVQYFKDIIENYDKKEFEDFKTKVSLIKNDEKINGTMVLSIHPMDYITMSDNASNWTSCMSWQDDGCYRIGTVEMMTSNNVICAYLKHTKENTFNFHPLTVEGTEVYNPADYSWNDKKWRNLIYITKDIIMGGKAYPYANDDFTKYLITKVKILARENLKWTYTFGPELYHDMKHIYSLVAMQNNRDWIYYDRAFKHNILWDTKGMYNDMLNANGVKYWCYRNKVNSNKIISVSGKAPCLCCGQETLEKNDDWYEDYNDRYVCTHNVVCPSCMDKYFRCYKCSSEGGKGYFVTINGETRRYCKECLDKVIKTCPGCGSTFELNYFWYDTVDNVTDKNYAENVFYAEKNAGTEFLYADDRNETLPVTDEPDMCYHKVYCCPECKEKLLKDATSITVLRKRTFGSKVHSTISIIPEEIGEKYNFSKLGQAKYVEEQD